MFGSRKKEGDSAQADRKESASDTGEKSRVGPPSISLPKGGGAIRGMGEKFAANPVTGTGSLTVPVYTSPGRSGFGPQLSLSYDSGAGNGPFGLGWNLSPPQITRKTDKGLPRYHDAEESDVFILSGAEDLAPVFKKDSQGNWVRDAKGNLVIDEEERDGYVVRRYRPRIEGLFARIERWTRPGDVYWRSISKDNITTWYGKGEESRIADPSDLAHVFTWLISESYDDKGNAILYRYKKEDSTAIDLSQVHEKNRTDTSRSANRYLKGIRYCNRTPRQTDEDLAQRADWLFEAVFDYGEHDLNNPQPDDSGPWLCRHDPFSSYRAGFEVRTYRLCQRVLMFHHFPGEQRVGRNCLVRSTDFVYRDIRNNPDDLEKGHPVASFIAAITQAGYRRRPDGSYLSKSLPPLECEYSQAIVNEEVRELDPQSLENLPSGLDGARYEWVDLDGEGISGILTRQAGGWFYKRNLSPITVIKENGHITTVAGFAPVELVPLQPSLTARSGRQQFLDLAADGQVDLVQFDLPLSGYYERTQDGDWSPFIAFESIPNLAWDDPNLKFVDLTGDGHADILISEDDVFVWYPSRAEAGFGAVERVRQALEEESGPRLVFADGTQSIYLADLSGDGLTDLVRIRNGEVCYWPNLGYGRFGAKVTMDDAPWFDAIDLFDQQRVRLADIDGSGTTDIIYLRRDGVHIYFNQSGNRWGESHTLRSFPHIDDLSAVTVTDLLGNGTACLVWSSPLPGDARGPMRYVDLMGGQKPHLLIRMVNNLGAETEVSYAPSTKFYLQDERAGNRWVTKLPFPVHVVERVITYDRISRNRFVTRSAYHHGYFDGIEREFRGFGMVEQWDTEEFAALNVSQQFPVGTNVEESSNVPPVLTRTWFHTGVDLGRDHVSDFFAGLLNEEDIGEYYREPGVSDAQTREFLLDDTALPAGMTVEEEREACRALKGSMLRREVYALDGTEKEKHPYSVTEQNFTIRRLQPMAGNRHAVFFTHARESISSHYERNPADPRISHALTLEVDDFGNVERAVAIGYPRRAVPERKAEQGETHVTFTVNRFINEAAHKDWYRVGLPVETQSYEIVKPPESAVTVSTVELLKLDVIRDLVEDLFPLGHDAPPQANRVPYERWDWRKNPAAILGTKLRLIEQARTLYRKNDLTGPLPLGQLESLAVPFESYKLALTPGLLAHVFKRKQTGQPDEDLLPNPAPLLEGKGGDQGGYNAIDGNWWIPSGGAFFDPDADIANPASTAAQELSTARQHFYLLRKVTDPFGHSTVMDYDAHDLIVTRTSDAVGNSVRAANDYRVLQPQLVTDPNRNRTAAAFDALGMVVVTAVMGKEGENLGDLLEGFDADLPLANLQAFIADPQAQAASLMGKATTRIVYDLEHYQRAGQPPFAATLARETHVHDSGGDQTRIQISFSYSDGFGREIQKKIQAEAGDAPQRQAPVLIPTGDILPGDLVRDARGKPVLANTPRRWVGSGRTVFNNKGKPVRQYEPFFSATHLYEPEREMTDTGVSSILFYDPVERVVATLHPNHTYEKVVFDPWRQTTYDANDTVNVDPSTDDDVKGFFVKPDGTLRIPTTEYLPTWYAQRIGNPAGDPERDAAQKAAAHADTPTVAHLDALGRPFLTLADNGPDPAQPRQHLRFATRVELDLEGNQREVTDARDRVVMRYDYDMLGNRIHHASMEAGERWTLNDVAGQPVRAWDSRGHQFRTEYDQLRRPVRRFVRGTDADYSDPRTLNRDVLFEQTAYGEGQQNDVTLNLRTRVFRQYDGAGVVTNMGRNPATGRDEAYDFKGNLLRSSRQLARDYKALPDWSAAVQTEVDTYQGSTTYDALNRPVTLTTPDASVIRPTYNEANLLEGVEANLRGAAVATLFVTDIDYDARGQRTLIDYGNAVRTTYEYDTFTFRLVHILTRRNATVFPGDCPQPPPVGWPGCQVQNLRYTYDPVGNITHIRDDAQQTIYFHNRRVEPSNDYTYDAIYRLIQVTGREHLGQNGGGVPLPPSPTSYNDNPRVGLLHPSDGNAMGTYRQQYVYDEVGNFLEMIHRGTDPANPGWTRAYTYFEASLLEPGKQSNRLTRTRLSPNSTQTLNEDYAHDAHGNMTRTPHLQVMQWDFKDQLRMTQRQAVNAEDEDGLQHQGERTYYVYDAAGQRVRKITERASGQVKDERVYLGGFEIYRRQGVNSVVRETLHIIDDKKRIGLVETRTQGNNGSPAQLIRYQFGNHLGSASLEMDDQARVMSYEEYYPYGSTSYQAVRNQTETPKRYRYTGKERDEESGLYYHGARYYAPWLARWTSCDSAGDSPSNSSYIYVRNNPCFYSDPDGRTPALHDFALYELADAYPDGPGEKFVSDVSSVAKLYADYVTARLPSEDEGNLASIARYAGVGHATAVTSVVDLAAGLAGTLLDPDMARRGLQRQVLTVGRVSAEGVEDIKRGNTLSGVAKITTDVAFVLGTALGGVANARAAGVRGTYRPTPETGPQKLGQIEGANLQPEVDYVELLKNQVKEVQESLRPFQGQPIKKGGLRFNLLIGGAISFVKGKVKTVIAVSEVNAHTLLDPKNPKGGLVALPEGVELGPPPKFVKGVNGRKELASESHVEQSPVRQLESEGARGGYVTTTSGACEACSKSWFKGEFSTWLHLNWQEWRLPGEVW